MKKFVSFLSDDSGFLLSSESVIVGTLLVLGLIVGVAEVRNAVVEELGDYSQAVAWLSQDFAYTSVSSANITSGLSTSGSRFSDNFELEQTYSSSASANGIVVTTMSLDDDE
jgi:hypothetical protein